MNIQEFKSQLSTAGLSRSYNWVCRVYTPTALSSIMQEMYVQSNSRLGGGRINLPLPGFNAAVDIPSNIPLGDFGAIGLNIGNNIFGTPNRDYVLNNIGSILESLNLYCASTSIPARDTKNVQWSEYGEQRKLGHVQTHGDVKLKYYCSENLFERFFFEQWQNLIYNPDRKEYGYYHDYVADIEIVKYNAGWSNIEAVYKLEEAYPSNIGDLPLNHADNSILQLDVTFKYKKFTRTQ